MGGVNEELLKQLAPAHAPPPPGWWPLAPGWWGLAALLIVTALLAFVWLRRPARKLRIAALRELRQLERNADDAALARGLEHLLRRYAVARHGREPVARLSGERWIAFVAANGGAALAGEPGRELLRTAYGGSARNDHRAAWLSAGRGFLRGRR
jgi:predicted lysophospholipase L1 biosynthesis ABC-type transport system permease subunit